VTRATRPLRSKRSSITASIAPTLLTHR